MVLAGFRVTAIAKEFQVTRQTISRVLAKHRGDPVFQRVEAQRKQIRLAGKALSTKEAYLDALEMDAKRMRQALRKDGTMLLSDKERTSMTQGLKCVELIAKEGLTASETTENPAEVRELDKAFRVFAKQKGDKPPRVVDAEHEPVDDPREPVEEDPPEQVVHG